MVNISVIFQPEERRSSMNVSRVRSSPAAATNIFCKGISTEV
jgi:hypothetical protein